MPKQSIDNQQDLTAELERISSLVREYKIAYFLNDDPLISDATYDELVRDHAILRAAYSSLVGDDWQELAVGAPPASRFTKIPHAAPVLSLENAFTSQDVVEFFDRVRRLLALDAGAALPVTVEPKIDGLSAALTYVHGQFVQGATRGDGTTGEDVTANLRTIADVPQHLRGANWPDRIEVRGEVYMRRDDFAALNVELESQGKRKLANPRNGAAGSLRQSDASVTAARPLRFLAHGWAAASSLFADTQAQGMTAISSWGFAVCHGSTCAVAVDETVASHAALGAARADLPFDIDGVVYKVDDLAWQARLGASERAPRWAIARKFAAECATTRITNIVVQVGRTGSLTPVAWLAPLNIGGVVVSKATLHNEDEISRLDIRLGDLVEVQRAGDVIPQILRVVSDKESHNTLPLYSLPQACPVCGSKAVREAGAVVRRCVGGLICPAQVLARITHFVSQRALDVDGLGPRTISELHSLGWLSTPAAMFRLHTHSAELLRCQGWKEKSVTKLLRQIDARRAPLLERLIYALGIRHVGEVTSRELAREFGTFDIFRTRCEAAAKDPAALASLTQIESVGSVTSLALAAFFDEPRNRQLVDDLASEIVPVPHAPTSQRSDLAGKNVVFSGTLEGFSRNEAKARAEALGARVMASVSAKTDILVQGADSGSKAAKAAVLGVRIMDVAGWRAILGNGG